MELEVRTARAFSRAGDAEGCRVLTRCSELGFFLIFRRVYTSIYTLTVSSVVSPVVHSWQGGDLGQIYV